MKVGRGAYIALAGGLAALCGLLGLALMVSMLRSPRGGSAAPSRNLGATLAAATPMEIAPATSPQPAGDLTEPTGKIVFTCQVFRVQARNQICISNPDGTGFRRITSDNSRQHHYPSLSPDGEQVVYAAFLEANVYEIYEYDLAAGVARRLTDHLGVLGAPEISPDGRSIVFTRWTPASEKHTLWMMDRDGTNLREFLNPEKGEAWDPTWSPVGDEVLLASDMGGSAQLWITPLGGGQSRSITALPALRGRSDWSTLDQIVTYSGPAWERELFIMGADGSGVHQVGPTGGNSQGPSFSPDGKWITFTAYFDSPGDIHGCEIYLMRADGTDLRRLTENDYCDYQPRWGP